VPSNALNWTATVQCTSVQPDVAVYALDPVDATGLVTYMTRKLNTSSSCLLLTFGSCVDQPTLWSFGVAIIAVLMVGAVDTVFGKTPSIGYC